MRRVDLPRKPGMLPSRVRRGAEAEKHAMVFPRLEPCGNAPLEFLLQGRRVLMFGSNDYLGLSNEPQLLHAAEEALRNYGSGVSGSRILNGTRDLHLRLEETLAAFLGLEAAMVTASGYQANLAALSVLLGRADTAISDRLNHASILDGISLSRAKQIRFDHCSLTSAKEALVRAKRRSGSLLLIAEGVHSMLGDVLPIGEFQAFCAGSGLSMLVDDAHGIGVLGSNGRGVLDQSRPEMPLRCLVGTFSKAFGSQGGFCAGTRELIDCLRFYASSYLYSAALSPPSAGAALAALDIIQREPERRRHLLEMVRLLHAQLQQAGFQVCAEATPILPAFFTTEQDACLFYGSLLEHGIYVNLVYAPAAPRPMLRISVTAKHGPEQVALLVEALLNAARKTNLCPRFGWASLQADDGGAEEKDHKRYQLAG